MTEKPRFGKTGMLAKAVFEYFELCLALVTALVVGLTAFVVSSELGTVPGLLFLGGIGIGVVLTVLVAQLPDRSDY
jgi:hypothetical protein